MEFEELSDFDLVELSRRGDRSAFAALVTRHKTPVFSFLRHVLGSREDAKDLTQETFVQAYLAIGKFRREASFTTWLIAIANHLWKSWKRNRRDVELLHEEVASNQTEPDVDLCLDVRRIVASLPPHYRAVVVLRYVNGMSYPEIANALGISTAAAEVRAHRARNLLRRRLAPIVFPSEVIKDDLPGCTTSGVHDARSEPGSA